MKLRATLPTLMLLCCAGVTVFAQDDARRLMEAIKARMQGAKVYDADMRIKVDVSFMKVPESKAHVHFEAPDKTTIDAPGFAMIPKQGADLSAAKLLSQPYVAVSAGREMFQGVMMRKVTVIPSNETGDIAVATVWVDTTAMTPRKVVSTTRKGGTITAELAYNDATARAYCLPSYVKLRFDVGTFQLPKTMTGDFETSAADKPKPSQQATVEIWYSSYRIR
jgi:hypothetical protein